MSETPLKPPESPEHSPVWLAQAIEWAHARGATDVHLFPSEGEAALWIRVDGELVVAARYPLAVHSRMIARLKVMGRCSDYAGELIQEGRFSLNGHSAAGEARLSVLPTLRGEKAVIRLMAGSARFSKFDELGFSPELIAALRAAMDRPQGLILASGPSGYGGGGEGPAAPEILPLKSSAPPLHAVAESFAADERRVKAFGSRGTQPHFQGGNTQAWPHRFTYGPGEPGLAESFSTILEQGGLRK
ncbi:Flp pilus assembly complex ATPase component TadA, partial [Candidatus Sumerlaeota bacterium]|nr:Flp pilus assembly complex ATPase component TadA [Candidatus Sumerlaeota bacterium]